MTIISISRGSYSRGKTIAERLAKKLGYECLDRDIILEASKEFNIPEMRLMRALRDSPSFFERLSYQKEKYISYIQHALLLKIKKDNIIYHGLAGHFFLKNVPNVLKVRVIANAEDRVSELIKRENISKDQAKHHLQKIDEQRVKWSQYLYGIDTNDSSLYDLVIHVDRIRVDQAVSIIASTAELPCFQSDEKSEATLNDLYIAAKAKAALVDIFPSVNVNCEQEVLFVESKGLIGSEDNSRAQVIEILQNHGITNEVDFKIDPIIAPD